jgi:hypothetical protein
VNNTYEQQRHKGRAKEYLAPHKFLPEIETFKPAPIGLGDDANGYSMHQLLAKPEGVVPIRFTCQCVMA